ncbi:hypothetical protein FHS68_004641 [Dyadobacter arcticus]|uniref:Uncharacterized protein n=1 Tax=Dyadobacter arcticus TaxID=1078754 RepID=A0ABX0URK5_9BACT|nr:hypothetical protein [Dyadobacter arcticus]
MHRAERREFYDHIRHNRTLRLFKYVHPNRINILENLSIRFTQPNELNDPIFVRNLEPASILNIFFGVNSDVTLKEDILKILARPNLSHVGVFQSVIDENEYKVIFERVDREHSPLI